MNIYYIIEINNKISQKILSGEDILLQEIKNIS